MRGVAVACLLFTLGRAFADEPVPLSLEKSVELAVKNATQILEAQNQLTLSAAEVLERYGQFLPNLNGGASYGYQSGKTLYTIDGYALVDANGQAAALSISSTLNLFNGLADYAGLQSALARRRAREQTLDWAEQQVALDVTQTYLNMVFDQQLLDIAGKNLVASQARLKLLQGQADVGSASIPDLFRQKAETSADSFSVVSYESRVEDDRILLIRKLRVDPTRTYVFSEPDLSPGRKFGLYEKSLPQLVAEALAARQDIVAAQSQLESSNWDVTGARSTFLPRLDLVFSRDASGQLLSKDFLNGQNALFFPQQALTTQLGNQVEYSIGLNLTWSIFDRFVTHYNSVQARVNRDNAEIALEDTRLQTEADVRTAYANYASALKQLDAAQTGVSAAEKSFQAVDGSYRVGSSSIVDVLTAQAALVQARSNQAQSLTNLMLQRSALEYAVGGLSTGNR